MRHKDQPKRANKRLASIDGIVSDGRRLGAPLPKKPKAKAQTAVGQLDDITKLDDGFHPMRQSPGGLGLADAPLEKPDQTEDEPIIIDAKAGKKTKRFGLKRPGRRFFKHAWLCLTAFILVGAILFATNLFLTYRHVLRGGGKAPALAANVDINQLKGEGDGRINILLLGIGGHGHDGPNLTDTIMLASIDPINHKTVLLSIPRDLWVQIPGDGYNKINAAYPFGLEQSTSKNVNNIRKAGLQELDKTLQPILGVPIHYHAIVSFKAFKDGVDAVGGVTVNVPKQLYDPTIAWENGYNPVIAKKGPQKFNGQRALLYAKSRETSSDFDRGERQRLLLTALKDKVLSLGTFSNPVRISHLLSSLGNNVHTDFSLSDLTRLYQIIGQIPSKQITSLDFVKPPHQLLTTANINGLSIVRPIAGLFDYRAIQAFVRSHLKDSYIIKESASVAIYNATDTPGLATKESKLLKSYGYRVTTVANASHQTNPPTTQLIDMSQGKAPVTKHYLENRYHTTAVGSLPSEFGITPPLDTAFVIIIGKANQ